MSPLRPDPSHRTSSSTHLPSLQDPHPLPSASRPLSLSVIVPAHNEAEAIPTLLSEIAKALRPLVGREEPVGHRFEGFEIVLIDDGSSDSTTEVLTREIARFPELRVLRFAANAGQSAATAAGFRAARGRYVATIDADLQNNPADLAKLWKLLPGYDAVLGWRERREDSWTKRQVSRWANRVRNAVLKQSIRDTGCSVRIFPTEAARRLPMFFGSHRFFGPLLLREGCSIRQEPVGHRPRPHGESHYSFRNRSFRVVVDLLGVAWLMRRSLPYTLDSTTSHRESNLTAPTVEPVPMAAQEG